MALFRIKAAFSSSPVSFSSFFSHLRDADKLAVVRAGLHDTLVVQLVHGRSDPEAVPYPEVLRRLADVGACNAQNVAWGKQDMMHQKVAWFMAWVNKMRRKVDK